MRGLGLFLSLTVSLNSLSSAMAVSSGMSNAHRNCDFGFGNTVICSGSWSVTVPGRQGARPQGEASRAAPPKVAPASSQPEVGGGRPNAAVGAPRTAIQALQRAAVTAPYGNWCRPSGNSTFLAWLNGAGKGPLPPCSPPRPPTPTKAPPVHVATATAPTPTPSVSPETLALHFWRTIALPAPRPSIPPGWAITGKLAYLVTGGTDHPASYRDTTPLGELTLNAVGTYEVNWGDGSTTGPYQGPGLPWPSGRITHTYTSVGRYTVVVSERWSATWRLGDAAGTVTGLVTTATIASFPVRQIQVVVVH